jgi:hypothetical protein
LSLRKIYSQGALGNCFVENIYKFEMMSICGSKWMLFQHGHLQVHGGVLTGASRQSTHDTILKVFRATHMGFSIAHSLCPTFRPVYVGISLTVQLPSSAHFQKMLETSICKRCPFFSLEYEDRLLHILILSIGLISPLQCKVT